MIRLGCMMKSLCCPYLIVSHDSEVILWVFLPIQRPNQADDSTPWVNAEHAWMGLHQSVGGVAVDS